MGDNNRVRQHKQPMKSIAIHRLYRRHFCRHHSHATEPFWTLGLSHKIPGGRGFCLRQNDRGQLTLLPTSFQCQDHWPRYRISEPQTATQVFERVAEGVERRDHVRPRVRERVHVGRPLGRLTIRA